MLSKLPETRDCGGSTNAGCHNLIYTELYNGELVMLARNPDSRQGSLF